MATEPIAIVGASCRLPGSANNLDSLWKLFANGGEAWSPVPSDRFNENSFYHPQANYPNGTNHHHGGHFIDGDVRDFDHTFFHISPQQAAAMDPQQRILLELAYEACESAGWPREKLAGSQTAVFAAIFGTDYERNLCKDVLDLPPYQSVGTGAAILANRISHAFDLRGPSVTLDTGCSGGLVALHWACQSLRSGESEAALVASANLQLMPDHYIGMSNQQMLASTGRCFPFDVRGKGYGRGEGFVVVALKRLSDAIRDRDPICSIILNTGINQDGYTPSGITHPNRVAQAALILETYARIGLRPQDIVYVEAHGTGTVAGDKEELAAITDTFLGSGRSLPLYVGSNKGSIGHTESTSGLASLLKSMLMLQHKIIPPVAGFATPKPGLPLNVVKIPKKQLPWPVEETISPPRISINSFGYGGANAHAILQEGWRTENKSNHPVLTCDRLFPFCAKTRASLLLMLQNYANWFESHPDVSLADISYALCHRRSALPWRFSLVVNSIASLSDELQKASKTLTSKPLPPKRRVIFVFTGQGAQWAGMGRELLLETTPSSAFSASIRISRDILQELGASWDLEYELIYQDNNEKINQADFAQPATTAVQIALVDLLISQGIKPVVVVGHSSGEIAAAYAAGRLSHHTAIHVAFHRGFMAAASKTRGLPKGAMLSVGLGEDDAAPYVRDLTRGKALIACVNSPNSVTVSGDADAVDEVMSRIASRGDGMFCRKLLVDTAYHSHHMRAVADEYQERIDTLDYEYSSRSGEHAQTEDEVVFVSSVTGESLHSDFSAAYWTDNLVSPVRFSDAIHLIVDKHYKDDQGLALFLEIGPHSAMAGPVRQCLSAPDAPRIEYEYLSALKRGDDAVMTVLKLAGRLFECGISVNFENTSSLVPGYQNAVVRPDLPSYSWDHSLKHWHESRLSRDYRMRREPYHDLLGVRMTETPSTEPRWRHIVDLSTLPWLADHVIDHLIIFPGAGYVCMAIEAILQLSRELDPKKELEAVSFRKISFLRALVVPDAPSRVELQLSFKQQGDVPSLNFFFTVTALSDGKWNDFCTGYIQGLVTNDEETDVKSAMTPTIHSNQLSDGTCLVPAELYKEMAANGNIYGPAFMGLSSITLSNVEPKAEAVVEVADIATLMPAQHQAQHILHPTTFDSLFHVGIPIIKRLQGAGSVMPVRIDELLVSTDARALSSPGNKLHVAAALTSSQFRASNIDMNVTVSGKPVLSALQIESRSLATHLDESNGAIDDQKICYELTWRTDLDFLRTRDFPSNPSISDLFSCICFKSANLKVAEIGRACAENMAVDFLTSVGISGGTVSTYDIFCTFSRFASEKYKTLAGYPINYHDWDPERNDEPHGPAGSEYDVILTSDINLIGRLSTLLYTTGVVVLVLDSSLHSSWQKQLQNVWPEHEVQLSFKSDLDDKLVVVARSIDKQRLVLPLRVRVITHSSSNDRTEWATSITQKLTGAGYEVMDVVSLNEMTVQPDDDIGNILTVVIDDLPQPILSDHYCFDKTLSLLRQSNSRTLWLSLDKPAPMHQITGVARTAHAENDNLRLTTVHIAPESIENSRATDLVTHCLDRLANDDKTALGEREYRLNSDAEILVPRLHNSERLNQAIRSSDDIVECTEIEPCRFVSAARSLALKSFDHSSGSNDMMFLEHPAQVLGNDSIEIDTEAFVLSKPHNDTRTDLLGEYAGIVRSVGSNVKQFVPGDAVVALCMDGVIGANRPHIQSSNAILRPHGISSSVAVAMFLPVLAATHALQCLARLPMRPGGRNGVVLIHGALSDIGRATVAVARTLGAKIVATATDQKEAQVMMRQLDIDESNIIVNRPSLFSPRRDDSLKVDTIIIQTEEGPVPTNIWDCLKPFGQVIVLASTDESFAPASASSPAAALKLPRNTTVHFCHISHLLHEYPGQMAELRDTAALSLKNLPSIDLKLPTLNVAQFSEALHMLRHGSSRVILEVRPKLLVRALSAAPRAEQGWDRADASYVVAGGMGDLGRRLLLLMARRGAMHLITLSRRVITSEDHDDFEAQLQLSRPGCRLYCLSCDVTSERSLQDASVILSQLNVPPVRGVIQSAVLLQDHTLETMTFDNFRAVTNAKVDGTLALEKAFTSPHLHFFIMLSSAVSITGASGQANYNAGNAVQDAMAHARGPGFLSMNIGWIEDAVNTANDKTILQGLWRTGLKPITPEELSRYFDYLLSAASSHSRLRQAVIGFNKASLTHTSAGNSNVKSPLFCHVRGSHSPAGSEEAASSGEPVQTFNEVVKAGDPEAVVDYISAAIINQLANLISVDATQINDRSGSILGLGLDSLVAIELRNWITRQFEAPLQTSEILTDQVIRELSKKVAFRSSILSESKRAESISSRSSLRDSVSDVSPSTRMASITSSISSESDGETRQKLPPLPISSLEDILEFFETSRSAVDTADEQAKTTKSVRALLEDEGPALHEHLRNMESNAIADAYDRQVYLERREPLHEQGSFIFIHPVHAPRHSQSLRAAILTVAAFEFAQDVASGKVVRDTLHGQDLSDEGRKWLFNAARVPCVGVDRVERHAANYTIAVLRRGHVFQLQLPNDGQSLRVLGVLEAYNSILEQCKDWGSTVCTLTADERDSWAMNRQHLEQDPQNAAALSCIDKAMFVVCLDEESPAGPSERYTHFLLNGEHRLFSNRWLDKPLQISVAANGLSAEIYEHSKLDGLDSNALHRHLVRAVLAYPSTHDADNLSPTTKYILSKHAWKTNSAIQERINHVKNHCRSHGPLDYQTFDAAELGLRSLRDYRCPPNATSHLTVLLALYLVDGKIRPAWEKLSLGTFARGRVDWIQTVSPAARAFIEAAAAMTSNDSDDRPRVSMLLRQAATTHSRALMSARQGLGAVSQLYALRAAAQEQQMELPALFKTDAWAATQRGGPGQEVKLGFMRRDSEGDEEEEDDDSQRGDEGEAGFLVGGETGIYVHCNVLKRCARFAMSGKPAYVARVREAMDRAVDIVVNLLQV